jgi:hypothetical protein
MLCQRNIINIIQSIALEMILLSNSSVGYKRIMTLLLLLWPISIILSACPRHCLLHMGQTDSIFSDRNEMTFPF